MTNSKLILEILFIISTETHLINWVEKVGVAKLIIKCGYEI